MFDNNFSIQKIINNKVFITQLLLMILVRTLPFFKIFILIPLIIKFLGNTEYGAFNQVISIMALLSPFAIAGLNISIKKFFPGEKNKEIINNDFWSIITLVVINSVILMSIVYLSRDFIVNSFLDGIMDFKQLLIVGMFLIPLNNLFQLGTEYLISFTHTWYYIFIMSFRNIFEITFIVFLIVNGKGLLWVFYGMLFFSFISVILLFIYIGKKICLKLPKIEFKRMRKYAKVGLPLFISGLSYIILYHSDRLLIGYFLDLANVSYYSVMNNISSIIFILSNITFFGTLPLLSYYWNKKKIKETKETLSFFISYSLILIIPTITGLLLASKKIIPIIATSEYIQYSYLIYYIAFGFFFNMILGVYDYIFILNDKTNYIFTFTSISALLNLVLNIILIPLYGIAAAAATTFFSLF